MAVVQIVLIFLPALIPISIAGVVLHRFTGGGLRSGWIKTLVLITTALAAVEGVELTLETNRLVGPYGPAMLAFGLAIVGVALVAVIVHRQIGGPLVRPSLWLGTAIAAFSLIAKMSTGGWGLFGEMITGIAAGTPVVHVLVRLVASERRKDLTLLFAGIASDALLLTSAMLRVDATDTPAWVTYRKFFFDEYGVPSWIRSPWGTDLNYDLYVPVVISWVLLLWLSTRSPPEAN